MIKIIAQKELKENIRDGRFRILSLLFLSLLVLAFYTSHQHVKEVNQLHEEAKEKERDVWVSQEAKNPHSAAHYGSYAFKPKHPMSLIDQGVDRYTGVSIFMEAHRRNDAEYMAAQDQTALSRFGDLSPDFILLFLIPLMIILMGFNAFTREKESGTLRILKSMGVRPWKMVLGKWLGAFLPILILLLPVFVLGGFFLSSLREFGEFQWGPYLILLALMLIYFGVFLNLSLWVSSLVKRSSIAFVLLLGIWILSCLALPKVANSLAEKLHPYPNQRTFEAAIEADKKKGLDGHDLWSAFAKKIEEEVKEEYGVEDVKDLPFNFNGYLLQKDEESNNQIYHHHYLRLKEIYENQANVYRSSALLSPYLPARFLSMAFCRTDYQAHWHFSHAAEEYRMEMMDFLNSDFAEHGEYGDWSYKAEASLWEKVPPFSYESEPFEEIIAANTSNMGVLLLWFFLSGLLLMYSGNRMKL